ncbi:hypothetical protein JJB27_03640 [Campylobacter fetus subsp. venerealis]|uniref:hypothetical protein n=1 Tax=Campylobacter fetus TaxID=196 RepID=UPI000818A8A2|nr:hypothetical protein [Campylobacter fetus]MBK3498169.1 hypothetical protein [Campylobacter fetus subsp. venerealis]MBK3502199.1 hypothetical protein [Campylobacter fetus subsp. venerealis]OCS16805.1 hypothetical protein CfvWBT01109_01855 [Campylobacter fetus subsp. venerealis]
MQFEKIQSQIETELQNKKAYDKVLDRIATQLKATKKAEAVYNREKTKLENLIAEKEKLTSTTEQEIEQRDE